MTYIEQAIREAREAGWRLPGQERFHYRLDTGEFCEAALYGIFLDPTFWQCLGKARGWKIDWEYVEDVSGSLGGRKTGEWLENWHRFIDTIAEGRTAEDFFRELSK